MLTPFHSWLDKKRVFFYAPWLLIRLDCLSWWLQDRHCLINKNVFFSLIYLSWAFLFLFILLLVRAIYLFRCIGSRYPTEDSHAIGKPGHHSYPILPILLNYVIFLYVIWCTEIFYNDLSSRQEESNLDFKFD